MSVVNDILISYYKAILPCKYYGILSFCDEQRVKWCVKFVNIKKSTAEIYQTKYLWLRVRNSCFSLWKITKKGKYYKACCCVITWTHSDSDHIHTLLLFIRGLQAGSQRQQLCGQFFPQGETKSETQLREKGCKLRQHVEQSRLSPFYGTEM